VRISGEKIVTRYSLAIVRPLVGRALSIVTATRRTWPAFGNPMALIDSRRAHFQMSSQIARQLRYAPPRLNADSPVRPTDTPERYSGLSKRKFNRNERKGLRPEKMLHRPHLATKLCDARARGLPKRNLYPVENECHDS